MSFWNKLGLPSHGDIQQLQKCINQIQQVQVQQAAVLHKQMTLIDNLHGQIEQAAQVHAAELHQTHEKIAEILTALQEGQQEAAKARAMELEAILNHCQETTTKLTDTQNVLTELPAIKEYMYSLWEATKLVWINDLKEFDK